MFKPSIFIYLIFLVLFIKLIMDGYWKNTITGVKSKFKLRSFLILIIINILLAFFIDLPLSRFLSSFNINLLKKIADFGNHLGKGEILFSTLLMLIICSAILNFKKISAIFRISLMSSIFSGLFVDLIKIVFSRERPFVNHNPLQFFAFRTAIEKGQLLKFPYLSMPSGHTVVIVAAVVPLFFYFKNIFIRSLLVLLAIIVSFARIYSVVHWPSDVFSSIVLGIFLGTIIYNNNKQRLSD